VRIPAASQWAYDCNSADLGARILCSSLGAITAALAAVLAVERERQNAIILE
jgi:hypothetical protein